MSKEEIKHIGNCPERRNIWNPGEMIYAEHWKKVNKNIRGLNDGYGHLELLLSNDLVLVRPAIITQRDAFVAATVIQWLGSSIGQGFIDECQREIKKREAEFKAAQNASSRLLKGMIHP